MNARNSIEDLLVAAMNESAEDTLQQTDVDRALLRFEGNVRVQRRQRQLRRTFVAVVAAAAAVAVVLGGSITLALLRQNPASRHRPLFPKPNGTVSATRLPPAAMVTSETLQATAAPELVTNGMLWSVQNDTGSLVLMDTATLQVKHIVPFSQVYVHWELGNLARVGNVVILPVEGWSPLGGHVVAGNAPNSVQSAILRFDAGDGHMLAPILVRASGYDVVTPQGVWVETDSTELGLLDPTGSRITQRISTPSGQYNVYADGRLWGFDVASRSIIGIDPHTGRTVTTFHVGVVTNAILSPDGPHGLLLVAIPETQSGPQTGTYRFDTHTLRLSAGTVYGGAPPNGPSAWAIDGSRLWGIYGGALNEFNVNTMKMLHSYTVTLTGLNDTAVNSTVPVAGHTLYVSDSETHQIRAFDLTQLH